MTNQEVIERALKQVEISNQNRESRVNNKAKLKQLALILRMPCHELVFKRGWNAISNN